MDRRRFARLAGLAIGALALIAGFFWLAAYLLVQSGAVLQIVNLRPEKLWVEYDSVRSPWPGRLALEGFSIRVQTKKVQWLATADRIEGDVALLPLATKRFVASDVTAEGVVFRLRRRLDAFPSMDVPRQQMPPVRGFDNPPRPPPEVLYPMPEDRWRWTVSLHDWRLDGVREIWLDQYRYRGAADVEGGYTVRLKRTTRVRPTRFSFHGGDLHVGEETPVTGIDGRLVIASERFRHRQVRGMEALSSFDATLEARAEVPDFSFYETYMWEGGGLSKLSGTGTISGRVELRAADGSGTGWLRVRGHDLQAQYGEGTIAGDLTIMSRFPRIDLDTRSLDLTGTTLGIDRGRIVYADARDEDEAAWWLRATLESGTLRPGEAVPLEATARARMTDSRPLVGLFVLEGKLPAWLEEAFRVHGIRGAARLRAGDGLLALDRFLAEGETVRAQGSLQLASDSRRGVLMLTYRGLDLGVLLRDEETDYKFTDVDAWYEEALRQDDE